MKCFKCKNDIKWEKNENGKCQEARYKIVAIDRPYMNLFFHKECFAEIQDDLEVYITNNLQVVV